MFDQPFGDPAMSPRHAEVRFQGAHAVVHDLGSAAGTRLNGVPVRESHTLAEGDVLRLGDTMFVYTSTEPPPAADEPRSATEPELTGATASIEAVRRSIAAVAPHPRTVVVTGETGTGKEIVARLLHRHSGRSGPFVAVNCGGFTEGLLASELFGHVRGAFTGAVAEQQGLFRAARGGTLLLDEASDIPLAFQPTLLRVLETWQVRPVGSSRDVPVDVRVVAASNRELVSLVQQGLFRADLYARLAQWNIRLPPLRDRREDIPALSRALLAQLGAEGRALTPDLEEALLVHPWPLNVRGLSNVLSIAVIATPAGQPLALGPEVLAALEDNRIERSVLPPAAPPVELDRARLEELLRRFGGRVAELARHVGVSRPKLYRLLWSAELDPACFRRR
ncbi:sigma-54-dependent Fis family transcriptional regulator [Anaeromyxobacter oryzae]|uniref:sigma-54-dependent Fis family transcriptional regulator n=1 Tax=Anaeromyxobacter oryzae TaxID=2918170 RepID=UPI0020C0FC82|nr:sigma 54-interacting transcriptional regulator [Anaeromyxobacter oryzae]